MQCESSPRAELDLEEIGDYIARDNPPRAVSFIREIRERCTTLAANPAAAPLRADLAEGMRMVTLGHYLIFHTFDVDRVRMEHVLHGARYIPALFDA